MEKTMPENLNHPDEQVLQEQPTAPWVLELLRTSRPEATTFSHDCREAGATALALARARQSSQHVHAPLLGVAALVRCLAEASGASLKRILDWARLDLDRTADRAFGNAWGRLAGVLGLDRREALLHLRLTFAEEVNQQLEPLMLNARSTRRRRGTDLVSECEQFLEEASSSWDVAVRRRLQESEAALWEGYEETAGTRDEGL
jgi:hypothetical protein